MSWKKVAHYRKKFEGALGSRLDLQTLKNPRLLDSNPRIPAAL